MTDLYVGWMVRVLKIAAAVLVAMAVAFGLWLSLLWVLNHTGFDPLLQLAVHLSYFIVSGWIFYVVLAVMTYRLIVSFAKRRGIL